MSKQIIVTMNSRIGHAADSDSLLLERVSFRVNAAAAASKPATGTFSSPIGGAKAIIADGDVSQDVANAIAQGIKDVVGAGKTYKASEINNAGVITELVAPVPV